MLITDIAAENAWIRSIRSRMQESPHAVGVGTGRVGGDLDPRLLQLELDVVLAHEEVDRLDPPMLAADEIHCRVEIVRTHHLRDLGETLTDVRRILRLP